MTVNEYSALSSPGQSLRYEQYAARMAKLGRFLAAVRRHRVALTVALALLMGLVLCFLGTVGQFIGTVQCDDFVYGEQPGCSAKAFLSAVTFQYAPAEGEAPWSDEVPVVPGQYRLRAVSKNILGASRYSQEVTVTLLPRKAVVRINSATYIYGSFRGETVADYVVGDGLAARDRIGDVTCRTEGSEAAGYRGTVSAVRILNGKGEDVTGSYILSFEEGTFTMQPRPIQVDGGVYEKEYDGQGWTGGEALITGGSLAFRDSLQAEFPAGTAEAGTHTLTPICRILDENGKDVTACYAVTVTDGRLTVLPRKIAIRTGGGEKTYDGKPLENKQWTILGGEVVEGHTLTGHTTGSRSVKGKSPNKVELKVVDSTGTDVTDNYAFDVEYGMLEIHPILLKFQTNSQEKVYDGIHTWEGGCKLVSGYVISGHTLSYMPDVWAKDAGVYKNTLSVTVMDEKGENVKDQGYEIEVDCGTITIYKRPVTITSDSDEKYYDGTPLTCWKYQITDGSIPDNFVGEGIRSTNFTGSQTAVGSSDNTFTVTITDKHGNRTEHNYDITYQYGTLTVKENPNHSQGGGQPGEMLPGGSKPGENNPGGSKPGEELLEGGLEGSGIGTHGKKTNIGYPPRGQEELYATVSNVWGLGGAMVFYFRDASYGDYNGIGWDAPREYIGSPGGVSELLYVGRSLEAAGGAEVSMKIQRVNDCPVIVPYHLANRYSFYNLCRDCYFTEGDYAYDLTCYPEYSYEKLKNRTVVGSDSGPEKLYREFVYGQYLQVPVSTRRALEQWAQEAGLRQNSATLVGDIQKAIQNAAVYNSEGENYPGGVDTAVYFLTQAKEGICQHFATAATLVYRIFGIPARYTVGFMDTLVPGMTTELTTRDAHAWVEIYVDGLGWVPVEVTGSNTPEEKKVPLHLRACSAVKYYDGKDFSAYDLSSCSILSGALKEGHRLSVTYQAGKYAYSPGTYENRITGWKIYDSQGKDVSNQYQVNADSGWLKILPRKIVIMTGSATKQYDGKPLKCDEYWIAEGSLAPGDVLTVYMHCELTNPGKRANEIMSWTVFHNNSYGGGFNAEYCYEVIIRTGQLEVTAP